MVERRGAWTRAYTVIQGWYSPRVQVPVPWPVFRYVRMSHVYAPFSPLDLPLRSSLPEDPPWLACGVYPHPHRDLHRVYHMTSDMHDVDVPCPMYARDIHMTGSSTSGGDSK